MSGLRRLAVYTTVAVGGGALAAWLRKLQLELERKRRRRAAMEAEGLRYADPVHGMVYRLISGVPYAASVSETAVRALQRHFAPRASDVFVCAYPRCGASLMRQIVALLLARDASVPIDLTTEAPWLEAGVTDGSLDMDALNAAARVDERRRVFSTHAPPRLFPAVELDGKVIYVARNVKDACASAFREARANQLHEYDGSWEAFFSLYRLGYAGPGSWFEHVRAWWCAAQTGKKNILWVSYEDLLSRPRDTVGRVAFFLGVDPTEAVLDAVIAKSSFRATKGKDAEADLPFSQAMPWHRWRGTFTAEQSAIFDEALYRCLRGCAGLSFDFGLGQTFVARPD